MNFYEFLGFADKVFFFFFFIFQTFFFAKTSTMTGESMKGRGFILGLTISKIMIMDET